MLLNNNRGQGLIEYLILVALIAIGTVGAVRLLQQSIGAQYSNVIRTIQGDSSQKKFTAPKVSKSITAKRDLGNFMSGTIKNKDPKK